MILRTTLTSALLAAAAVPTMAMAQTTPAQNPATSGISRQSVDAVRAHMHFLADDLLEGRGTGTRGHEIAARYVASQFEMMGLQPAGEKGSYFQWVPMRRSTTGDTPPASRLTVGGKDVALAPGSVTVMPSLLTRRLDLDAPVVFVGYGLDDKALGLNDYAGLDVKGKIVVAMSGTPKGLNSDIAAHLIETKADVAARRGAAGFIALSPRAPSASPAPEAMRSTRRTVTDWVSGDKVGGGDSARLSRLTLTAPAMEALFANAPRKLADLRAAVAASRPIKGFKLPARLAVSADFQWEDFKSPEVVAMLPGTDPLLKQQYVAMMGHLDHIGIKKNAKPGEDAINNGALDNAAGVSTLLEAARRFTTTGAPKRSVLFVIHTGEELGLVGAGYYAEHPTVPLQSIVAGVDLDMPVPLYDFSDVVAFGADHSTVAATIGEAAASMGLGTAPDPMPEQTIFVRSDHYRFVEKGIPSVLLFTGYGNGGKDKFDDFFKKHYHSVSDDLNLPIRYDQLAKYAELNYRIAQRLADAPLAPRWYDRDYFGNLFAPGQPRAGAPIVGKAVQQH